MIVRHLELDLQSPASPIAPPIIPAPLMTYDEWLMGFGDDDSYSSTLVEPPTSPPPQSFPLYQSSLRPPPASPDKILFYDPEDEMYYEVSPEHILYDDRMNVGEVEVLDAVDVVLDSSEVVILDSSDVVMLDSPEIPSRRHLDGVRRHLF